MKRVLVTGGGGFVGSALVRRLTQSGYEVRVAGRNRYPHVETMGAVCEIGDVGDPVFADRICAGIDTVFHTAAKAGIWGSWQFYKRTNIDGTCNIVDACKKHKVPRLVYTSTPSVVFDRRGIIEGDESLPYATKYLCHYAHSKAIAERYVLAHNSNDLHTCAIRPHLIWGPGDPHLVPRLIERGKQGKLKIVGSGANLVDVTFVDNVVHSHLLAAQNLEYEKRAGGQAYFIGQEKPVRLWTWINDLYQDLGISPVVSHVPYALAYLVGATMEMAFKIGSKKTEPPMTRFLAFQLAKSHYFSHEKAKKELGYEPIVSLEDGKERLCASLKR